jgi:hypothetical protein
LYSFQRFFTRFTLSLFVILTISTCITGCKNSTQTENDSTKLTCIQLLHKIPADYESFQFWDARALREDPDMGDMYLVWRERKVDYLEAQYGIDITKIDYLAEGEGLLEIIKTEYDVKSLREKIGVDFYRDTEYQDIEVWKSPPANEPQDVTGGWVIDKEFLVRGWNNFNVDDYLNATGGKVPSMYDEETAGFLEKLPAGITVQVVRDSIGEIEMSGQSFSKETGRTLRWTFMQMWETESAAGSDEASKIYASLEDDLENALSTFSQRGETPPFSDFKLERDGRFVICSMLVDLEYAIALLFYG